MKIKGINTIEVIFTFLIPLFLIISICSCSNADKSTKETNKVEQIKYSSHLNWLGHYNADEKSRHRLIKEVEREFKLRNQEIELKLTFPKELYTNENQADSIASFIKTGTYKFDIIEMDPAWYQAIGQKLKNPDWGRKYLVDFSAFDWFKESHKEIIYYNKQIKESTGNIMPSPYIEGIYFSLWMNTKVLSQIGGTLKQFGMNTNDIHDLLNKIKLYNEKTGSRIQLFDLERGYSSIYDLSKMLFMSAYFGETDKEGDRAAGLKALKRVAEEFEYLHQQTQIKVPPIRWQFYGKCFKDTALMCIFPSWVFNLWQSADSIEALKMVPCELPIFEHDSKYYPGFFQGVFGVMKNSPNVDNAIKLMKYMCSESVAKRWSIYTKTPTGIKTKINSSDFDQNDYDKFYNYINKKYPKTLMDFDPLGVAFGSKYNSKYSDYLNSLYKVLEGEMSAKEYMSLFQKI